MLKPLIHITHRHALIFASFFVLYEFLTYIANDMIMPGMIGVVASFHGPESAVASSLTAYVLGGASLQLFLGPLSDRYGRRPVMLVGALLFFVFTLLIACTQSIDQFLVARFFQGTGLCFIGVVGYATVQEIFAEMDAIRLISVMSNIAILAPLLGPLLGAVFVLYFSWRLIFLMIGLFALIALWGLWRYMPEPVGQKNRSGVLMPHTPLAPRVIAKNYKELMQNPAFIFGSIALGLIGLPCVAWIGIAPVIIINDAHLSVIDYGLWQLPLFGATILGNAYLQRLTHKDTIKRIIYLGSALLGIGLLITACLPWLISSSFLWLIPGLVLYFFALGITGAPLTRLVLFSTHVSKGTASALQSMIAMCIQGLGIELTNAVYSHHSNPMFGAYCALIGVGYFIMLGGTFYYTKR